MSDSLKKYLDLPSHNMRNEKVLFDYLKDKVWKTLQGWKHKFFFVGGNDVLN